MLARPPHCEEAQTPRRNRQSALSPVCHLVMEERPNARGSAALALAFEGSQARLTPNLP